ncbi:F0F1 ATP synthase subunit gamma [Formicincola oecophyllae]|uniref:ATP synthase gamma chain n=1 Tax=Formicincola oecophyllae TaxID=2558361 RepID=A0A4Y6UA31_9PROT|nr:F0F1 ATP synthase subunit gamma [Formicincola oecophyllae]QDH13438.1 F0F1 ATP synthase subunit gamma [Formicincola oecophyllae]
MASLKELRGRITSVKSTGKITNAMKMVAASKLRHAQTKTEAAQPYAQTMRTMMGELANGMAGADPATLPRLLVGTGNDNVHLLIVITSDRGLVGGFNANLMRMVHAHVNALTAAGKTVKFVPVGRKGAAVFEREFPGAVVKTYDSSGGKEGITFDLAKRIAHHVTDMLNKGEIDAATLFSSQFVNAMTQTPTETPLVPLPRAENDNRNSAASGNEGEGESFYDFEPGEQELLSELLPRNLEVQIYSALLDSAAGEQGARMTAMDNASRNANKFIDDLSLTYNRTRQANITRELIEIISGAQVVGS